jgi:hypothetical protein
MGVPFGSPRSGSLLSDSGKPSYLFASEGVRSDAEEYEKRCRTLRKKYDGCFKRLNELGRVLGNGHVILITVRRICIEERYPNDTELGNLRLGLNALSEQLGVQ